MKSAPIQATKKGPSPHSPIAKKSKAQGAPPAEPARGEKKARTASAPSERKTAGARAKETGESGRAAKAHAQMAILGPAVSSGSSGLSAVGPALSQWLGSAMHGLGSQALEAKGKGAGVPVADSNAGEKAYDWKEAQIPLMEKIYEEATKRNIKKRDLPGKYFNVSQKTMVDFSRRKVSPEMLLKFQRGLRRVMKQAENPYVIDFVRAETRKIMDEKGLDNDDLVASGAMVKQTAHSYLDGEAWVTRISSEKVLDAVIHIEKRLPENFKEQKALRAEILETLAQHKQARPHFLSLMNEKDSEEVTRFLNGGYVSSKRLFERIKRQKENIGLKPVPHYFVVREMLRAAVQSDKDMVKMSEKTGLTIPQLEQFMNGIGQGRKPSRKVYEALTQRQRF